jgi:hypothetical protein
MSQKIIIEGIEYDLGVGLAEVKGDGKFLLLKLGNDHFPCQDQVAMDHAKAVFAKGLRDAGINIPVFAWNHAIEIQVIDVRGGEISKV